MQDEDRQEDQQHPLLLLRPPATDHLTYLTFIENLLQPSTKPSLDTRREETEHQQQQQQNDNSDDNDDPHNPSQTQIPTTRSPSLSFSLLSTVRLLHRILRADTSLTASIGWDLVQILLPHVGAEPRSDSEIADEAHACLLHIARCGNPREVVLKVGEALWGLGRSSGDEEDEGSDGETEDDGSDGDEEEDHDDDDRLNTNRQFTTLLSMLGILHQRIKAKRPSRFLSSSLQAILAAYEAEERDESTRRRRRRRQNGSRRESAGLINLDERTAAAVTFVKLVFGVKRPKVPERVEIARNSLKGVQGHRSSDDEEDGGQLEVDKQSHQHEPDPEADMSESTRNIASLQEKDVLSNGETLLQQRLLQAFVTRLLSRYIMATETSAALESLDIESHSIEELGASKKSVGLTWSIGLLEKLYPKRWGNSVSTPLTPTSRLDEKGYLPLQATVGELAALTRDLGLTDDELKAAVLESENDNSDEHDSREMKCDSKVNGNSEKDELKQDIMTSELDPPESAGDVPLCREGALFLLASRATASILYGKRQQQDGIPEESETANSNDGVGEEKEENEGTTADSRDSSIMSLFPEHSRLLKNILPASALSSIGDQPAPVIDALCALGIIALTNGPNPLLSRSQSTSTSIHSDFSPQNLSNFPDIPDFQSYIQTLSFIAATNPEPQLRAVTYHLATSILHAHPSASVRLLIIRDVLEHCPFQNLKESAVGWLKDETVSAGAPLRASKKVAGLGIGISNDEDVGKLESPDTKEGKATLMSFVAKHQSDDDDRIENPENVDKQTTNIFATPIALATTAPFLFPDLTDLFNDSLDMSLVASLPLYIATLNLLYLLLSARHLRDMVDTDSLLETYAVDTKFLGPLKRHCADKILKSEAEAGIAEEHQITGELSILVMTIDRVKEILENIQNEKRRKF